MTQLQMKIIYWLSLILFIIYASQHDWVDSGGGLLAFFMVGLALRLALGYFLTTAEEKEDA